MICRVGSQRAYKHRHWCDEGFHMCCLCFECIPIKELWVDEDGQRWDVCKPCQRLEELAAEAST